MTDAPETRLPKPERTPAAYRRDLHQARQVIGQLRDDAVETGTPFHVGNLALDAAALVKLWDGLDRVDTHFWEEKSLRRYMESRAESPMAERKKLRWKFWGTGQRVA